MKPALTVLAGCAALAGCAVGPSFRRPAAPADAGYANVPAGPVGAQTITPGATIPADWWTLFRSPELDALVRRAIAANPDLEAARAALRQARALARADRGPLLPSVGIGATTERARNAQELASPLQSNSNLYTLQTAQVSVGYTFDLFGGVRRQAESSAALAEAQRFQAEAAYVTLTTNIVVAAFTEASLREQIASTQRSVATQAHILRILRERFRLGDVARADVAAQEVLVAQTEQLLPPLSKQLAQQRDLIAALAGQMPTATQPRLDLGKVALPGGLPLSLPAALVDQRPDVRAAEAELHAAAAQVGVAIAARLPAITLTGAAGGSSTGVSSLFAPGNVFWNVIGGLTAPIFDGGTLRHRQRAAEAAYDQAKAHYRSVVLAAFQNVSDSLSALQTDAAALQAASRADTAASESLIIAQGQGKLGAVAPLQVLTAEQARLQASLTLEQARASVYVDTAALFQALGGGWWNKGSGRGNVDGSASPMAVGGN